MQLQGTRWLQVKMQWRVKQWAGNEVVAGEDAVACEAMVVRGDARDGDGGAVAGKRRIHVRMQQ